MDENLIKQLLVLHATAVICKVMILLKVLASFLICRVCKMLSSLQHNQLWNRMELGHTSYKLSQVLPDLAFREKSLSSSPKAPDLLTFGLGWDPGLTWGDFLFRLSRICRRIPTRSSSTWWFKATDVSIYLQQCVSANFLASFAGTALFRTKSILLATRMMVLLIFSSFRILLRLSLAI